MSLSRSVHLVGAMIRGRHVFRKLHAFVFVGLLWIGSWLGCSEKAEPRPAVGTPITKHTEQSAVHVPTAIQTNMPVTVVQTNMPVTLEAKGHVTPCSSVAIRSQVSGVLESVHFKEGDLLKPGDLLFTIDSRGFRDALARAKSDLAKDLGMQKQAASEQEQNAVLLKSKIVSQDSYNESAANSASVAAAVEGDQAAVDLAELELSHCHIYSPINGRAGFVQVSPGNLIPTGEQVLVTVNQTRPVFIDFPIPEQNLAAIRRAAASRALEVQIMAEGRQCCWTGELTAIDNTVDPSTHTILLRARFANEEEALWPGQSVNVRLSLAPRTAD